MSETRRTALRASYLCAAIAAGLLALHFNLGWLPQWTRGISLLSGGLALAGAGLAAASFGREDVFDIRRWPHHLALGLNGLLAAGFVSYVALP
jgi:hypothetical protein